MGVGIRDYRSGDRAQIVALFERFYDDLIVLDHEQRLRRLAGYGEFIADKTVAVVEQRNGAFYVAVDGETIAGFVVGVVLEQDEEQWLGVIPSLVGRITELYVDAAYRRRGLATRLMRLAESYLARRRCDAVRVEVFVPNVPARMLYAALGYVERDIELFKRLRPPDAPGDQVRA